MSQSEQQYLTDRDVKLRSVGVEPAEDIRPSAPLIEPYCVTNAVPVTVDAAEVVMGSSGHVPCHPDVPSSNLIPVSESWINNEAREASYQVNQATASSSVQGCKLSKEEEEATRRANKSGATDSRQLNKAIAASRNNDQLSDFYIHSANRTGDGISVAQPLEDTPDGKTLKVEQAQPPKPKGYQFAEYKSVYDDGYGGSTYQPQEYKSIYD